MVYSLVNLLEKGWLTKILLELSFLYYDIFEEKRPVLRVYVIERRVNLFTPPAPPPPPPRGVIVLFGWVAGGGGGGVGGGV